VWERGERRGVCKRRLKLCDGDQPRVKREWPSPKGKTEGGRSVERVSFGAVGVPAKIAELYVPPGLLASCRVVTVKGPGPWSYCVLRAADGMLSIDWGLLRGVASCWLARQRRAERGGR
jgi:hypothetical protein